MPAFTAACHRSQRTRDSSFLHLSTLIPINFSVAVVLVIERGARLVESDFYRSSLLRLGIAMKDGRGSESESGSESEV